MTGVSEVGQSNDVEDYIVNTRYVIAKILHQAHYDLFHYLRIYNTRCNRIEKDGYRLTRTHRQDPITLQRTELKKQTRTAFTRDEWGILKSAFGFIFDDSYRLKTGGTPSELLVGLTSIGYVRRKTLAEAKRTLTGPARKLFIDAYLELEPW